jgi:hypothetical protein
MSFPREFAFYLFNLVLYEADFKSQTSLITFVAVGFMSQKSNL